MSALKEEIPQEKMENQAEEKATETLEIKNPPAIKEKGELAPKNVMDMSFLFGNVKPKTEKAEKFIGAHAVARLKKAWGCAIIVANKILSV